MGFTTILNLNAGETISTWVDCGHADDKRNIANYQFTTFLLGENTDVSVHGTNHVKSGVDTIMEYGPPSSQNGSGWIPNSRFVAPSPGVYFFAITAVKDAFLANATDDDVFVHLYKNGMPLGKAWSGAKTGKRGGMAFSTMVRLGRGDLIETWAGSDNNAGRTVHVAEFDLTGFKLCH